MNGRGGQRRASDLPADPRRLSYEEVARLGLMLLPHAMVSLVLQCLLLVAGVRTVRQMYEARYLGGRPLLRVAASGPLLGLAVLNLANWVVSRRLSRWVGRVNATRSS